MIAPVEIRVRNDEFRRRRAPGRKILGRVRIADQRRVIAANKCAVQRRAHALVRLRADDDEPPDGEVREYGLERRLQLDDYFVSVMCARERCGRQSSRLLCFGR